MALRKQHKHSRKKHSTGLPGRTAIKRRMKGATKNGPIRRNGESENLYFCCCFMLGLNGFPVTFKYADPETRSSFVVSCQMICAAPLAGRCSLAYEIIVSSTDCHVFCTAPPGRAE
jgi:hypothetical protein